MRKIIIVDATLMNTEMTTVKDVNLDIDIKIMKADIRTIVARNFLNVRIRKEEMKLPSLKVISLCYAENPKYSLALYLLL